MITKKLHPLAVLIISPYSPQDFPGGSDGKASAYNTGDRGSIPGLGRSPGEGSGNPSAYLEVADTSPDNLDSSL